MKQADSGSATRMKSSKTTVGALVAAILLSAVCIAVKLRPWVDDEDFRVLARNFAKIDLESSNVSSDTNEGDPDRTRSEAEEYHTRVRYSEALALYRDSCLYRRTGAPVCPRLFILGAQKGGTTTVFHHIARHPDFTPAWPLDIGGAKTGGKPLKEVKYFATRKYFVDLSGQQLDQDTARQLVAVDYLPHFGIRKREQQFSVDSSPSYLYTQAAPEAIRNAGFQRDPEARFIVLLRDPIQRAVSAMEKRVREYSIGYNMEEVVNRCLPLLQRCREEAHADGLEGIGYFHCRNTLEESDLYSGMCEAWNRGFYVDALRSWLLAGYDGRKQFCILRTSKLFDGPEALMKETELGHKCLEGSGVDVSRFPLWDEQSSQRGNVHNTSETLRAAGLSAASVTLVERFYSRANEDLRELLEDQFGVHNFTF